MFPAWHQTDLTIIIPDPKMQHKGYGTEAIRIMLDMAFHEYEMHRVSIGVVGLNTDALKFYRKIGFKQEGILEEAYYYNNAYSDFSPFKPGRETPHLMRKMRRFSLSKKVTGRWPFFSLEILELRERMRYNSCLLYTSRCV